MTQTIITVLAFIVILAMVPAGVKWLQTRSAMGSPLVGAAGKVVSVIAVGPHQRVVTVEVGPHDARTWLILGVTPQTISCLHNIAAHPGAQVGDAAVGFFLDLDVHGLGSRLEQRLALALLVGAAEGHHGEFLGQRPLRRKARDR